MKNTIAFIVLATATLVAPTAVMAQLSATGPVVNGHHHFNASDIDAHLRFWVETLGGKPGTFGNGTPIVLFPDALIFLRDQAPTGPMIGGTVNHVGFSVPNLRETVDRLVAAGYEMVTAAESAPGTPVVDHIRALPGDGPVSSIAFVIGPDAIKVEVLEIKNQAAPIVSHHIHFFGDQNEAMRDWYVDVFGASERPGNNAFLGADLPGLNLNFTATPEATAGTAGRVLDHIGFEIEDLKTFVAHLETKGITFDVPYREIPAAGLALAFFTDPWGTYIELTEGLDEIH